MADTISASGRRRKGNAFELKIAKMMTKWTDNVISFTRSPLSGSWGSTHGKMSGTVSGDIITEDPNWTYSLELKNHEAFTSLDTLFHSNTLIQSFWQQALGDATRTKRVPILINHRNRSKIFATLPYTEEMHNYFRDNNLDYGVFNLRWHNEMLETDYSQEVITVVLDDLLEHYSYQDMIDFAHRSLSEWL